MRFRRGAPGGATGLRWRCSMAMHSIRAPQRGSLTIAAFLALAWIAGAHADTPATPSSPAPGVQPTTPAPAGPAPAGPAPTAKTFSVKTDEAQAAPAAEAKPATAAKPATSKTTAAVKPAAGKSTSTAKGFTTAPPAAPVIAKAAPAPSPDPGQAYIKPFPGSRQIARSSRNFDEYWMPLGKLSGESQAEKVERIEGRWIHAGYVTTTGPSVAEVFRHY